MPERLDPATSPPSSRRTTSGASSPTSSTRTLARRIGAAFVQRRRRATPSSSATTCGPARRGSPAPSPTAPPTPAPTWSIIGLGLDRPALLRLRPPRPPRRDVHRQPQPGAVQRHQAVPRRRRARSARTPASPRSATPVARRPRRRAGAERAGHRSPSATCSPTTPRYLLALVDLSRGRRLKVVVDAGNGMAGYTVPAVFDALGCRSTSCRCTSSSTAPSRTTRPTRSTRRTSSTCRPRCVEHGADIGLAFDGDADRCFVVDERGEPVSPSALTALIAARELASEPGRDGHPQPDHRRGGAGDRRRAGGTPVRTRVGHSFIKARWPRPARSSAASTSAHYYFRDFWRADTGMLAALHVLAALGRAGPAAVRAARRLRALRRSRRDQLRRSPTRPADRGRVEAAYAAATGVDRSTTSTG